MSQLIELAIIEEKTEVVRSNVVRLNDILYTVSIRKVFEGEEWKGELIAAIQEIPDEDLEESIYYDVLEFMKFAYDGRVLLLDRGGNYTVEFPIKGSPFDKDTLPEDSKAKTEWTYWELTVAMYLLNVMPVKFNISNPILRKGMQ